MKLVFDATDAATGRKQPATATKPQTTQLLIVMDRPLVQEAFAALVRREIGFAPAMKPIRPPSGEAGPCVALIDGQVAEEFAESWIAAARPIGGVLLVEPERLRAADQATPGAIRFAGLELTVLSYQSAWSEVIKALKLASRVETPHRGDRRGEASNAAELTPLAGAPDDVSAEAPRRCDEDLRLFRLLTRREKEVLAGIGAGHSPQQIAKQLHIAVSTAENHKSRLMKKLGVHKSIELVRFAIRVGAAPI